MDASVFNPRLTKSNRDFTIPGCRDFATMAERDQIVRLGTGGDVFRRLADRTERERRPPVFD